jgi:hypothetical protein
MVIGAVGWELIGSDFRKYIYKIPIGFGDVGQFFFNNY